VDDAEVRVLNADEDDDAVEAAREEVATEVARAAAAGRGASLAAMQRPMRRRLPDTRRSLTHKFNVAGHEGYLTVGLYEDGKPGELFITMAKEGSTIGGVMDSLGTAVSVALQYGVPIESLVKKFTHQRFEPAGMTTNRDIPFAKSLVDYIFRWMGMEFIEGYREANAPRRGIDAGQLAGHETLEDLHAGRVDQARRIEAREAPRPAPARLVDRPVSADAELEVSMTLSVSALSDAMRECQSDSPACEVCGEITVRNGACYKCLNCGHSMGCS
jgi:ribonucleoside-diphosphate reductase alpha chain